MNIEISQEEYQKLLDFEEKYSKMNKTYTITFAYHCDTCGHVRKEQFMAFNPGDSDIRVASCTECFDFLRTMSLTDLAHAYLQRVKEYEKKLFDQRAQNNAM